MNSPVAFEGQPASFAARLTRSRAHLAAFASWSGPLLVFALNFFTRHLAAHHALTVGLLIGLLSLGVFLFCIACALYALLQARYSKSRGVLAAAILGLVLNLLFVLIIGGLAISGVRRARASTSQGHALFDIAVARPHSRPRRRR